MSVNLNTPAIDQPGSDGSIWHRLHSEREEVCEALLKDLGPGSELTERTNANDENWHVELLQARLCKIDNALDRLMSGSYAECVKCGRWVEDTKLHFDPAIAFCVECWQRLQRQDTGRLIGPKPEVAEIRTSDSLDNLMQISPLLPGIELESLAPLDTLRVRTLNSDYRIFLLDSSTGRALVDGGCFPEPVEVVVNGSNFGGSTLKVGWIGIGLRIEMWAKDRLVSTSPVQSFYVERHAGPQNTSVTAAHSQGH
jgi:RNA polymerase-binding transcription factor DksA